jgi:polyisoprenoid-binding protein YceI
MKPLNRILILIVAVVCWSFSYSQTAYITTGDPQITIEGTSNVHDWEETVKTLNGSGTITWNSDGSFNLTSLLIKIDCKAIKSSHGSIMDNKTYDALKADKFPTITYKLTAPLVNVKPSASGIIINAVGQITIAGVTKSVTMQVKVIGTPGGQLLFEGTKVFTMTDFGVSPPTAFMGAMKVGDNVTVKFKANFSKAQASTQIN